MLRAKHDKIFLHVGLFFAPRLTASNTDSEGRSHHHLIGQLAHTKNPASF
jgi:hypothetical protein